VTGGVRGRFWNVKKRTSPTPNGEEVHHAARARGIVEQIAAHRPRQSDFASTARQVARLRHAIQPPQNDERDDGGTRRDVARNSAGRTC